MPPGSKRSEQHVRARDGGQQHPVAGAQRAAAAKGRGNRDVGARGQREHAAGVAADDHGSVVLGQRQPVSGAPDQDGGDAAVGDPSGRVDPADPVYRFVQARQSAGGSASGRREGAPGRPGAPRSLRAGPGPDGMTGAMSGAVTSASPNRRRDGRPQRGGPPACSSGTCALGRFHRYLCPKGDLKPYGREFPRIGGIIRLG
jgi:hypothetical protein